MDERLEALTQSVELMAGMHRDSERRFQAQLDRIATQFSQQTAEHEQLFGQLALRNQELGGTVRELGEEVREVAGTVREIGGTVRDLSGTVRQMMNGIDSLARVAGVHQERLDHHEERLERLEGAS